MIDIKKIFTEIEIEGMRDTDLSNFDYNLRSEDTFNVILEKEDGFSLEVAFLAKARFSQSGRTIIEDVQINYTNCWLNDSDEYKLNELELIELAYILKKKVQEYF